jgi:hypothetical protein
MLAVISPAKRLGTCPLPKSIETTAPRMANESRKLVEIMRTFDAAGLSELMHISASLAEENVQRFATWKRTCTGEAEPAVCLFQGDVYRGLAVDGWKATEHRRAASHLRILSGLYGLLRPHDMILPHRLEMGTKLDHERGRGVDKSPRPSPKICSKPSPRPSSIWPARNTPRPCNGMPCPCRRSPVLSKKPKVGSIALWRRLPSRRGACSPVGCCKPNRSPPKI